jgi:hypothetical protein
MATYKIIVPKVGSMDETGNTVGLYKAGEIINVAGEWQQKVMDAFTLNGWAMEIKTVQPDVTVTTEATITLSPDKKPPKPKKRRPRKVSIGL